MSTFKRPQRYLNNATAPVGSLIAEVGRGVAHAQQSLDDAALKSFKALYSSREVSARQLRQIGYIPTWYQIPETTAEIKLSISLGVSGQQRSGKSRQALLGKAVDAATQNQFNYQSELSSKINFRVVPIPPPITPQDALPVPELRGLPLKEAANRLEELDLRYSVAETQDEAGPEVLRHIPTGGELVTPNTTITLFTG